MKNINKVLIIENQNLTRKTLVNAVEVSLTSKIIYQASTIKQAEDLYARQNIDLVIINLNLPDGSGIHLLKYIKQSLPATFCVVISTYDDEKRICAALRAGAEGYLLQDHTQKEIEKYLSRILNNEPPLSPLVARTILQHIKQRPVEHSHFESDKVLSEREREVLMLTAKSYQRKEIANFLKISPHTVATHIKNIYSKLGITSKAEAVLEASKRGLVESIY